MKPFLALLAFAPIALLACSSDSAEGLNVQSQPDAGTQTQKDSSSSDSTVADTSSSPDVAEDSTNSDAAVDSAADVPADNSTDPSSDAALDDASDASTPSDSGADAQDGQAPSSCNFGYDKEFKYATNARALSLSPVAEIEAQPAIGPHAAIAHADPLPPSTFHFYPPSGPLPLVMPGYSDNMPLFDRAKAWSSPTRCYETPTGVKMLTEDDAYDLYAAIAEETTGVRVIRTSGVRSVVGIRGSYPGRFAWHGNAPNRFNDTLALLWIDGGTKHLREFPVNTDTGAHNFGADSSSSLRANRRYHHVNGTHKTYDALSIEEYGYRVRDDTNTNGHYDSDRNGWLAPVANKDHDRTGSGHNIHMGSVEAPLGTAEVDSWSAGCQVIPGMANWKEFITNAWTKRDDNVNYFLVDARDIAPQVWDACTPDGSHACPFRVTSFPFTDSRDTSKTPAGKFNNYNCSTANESGSEIVYEIRVDKRGSLQVSVECSAPTDIDIHLLEGDDSSACLIRNNSSFTYDLAPGRYLIVADTFVDKNSTTLSGPFKLTISFN